MSLTTLSPSWDRSWKGPLQANSEPLEPGVTGGARGFLAMLGKVTTYSGLERARWTRGQNRGSSSS